MKVNRSVLRASLLVFFASLSIPLLADAQIPCGDEAVFKLFSPYPSSDGLRYIAYSHACREPLNQNDFIFYSSWFLQGNPRVTMQTRINQKGGAEVVRSVFDWADQANRFKQLTEEQADAVAMAIAELPESAKKPPLAFLYVVSFKKQGEWMTRVYDRKKLPAAITKVHSIAGYAVISDDGE